MRLGIGTKTRKKKIVLQMHVFFWDRGSILLPSARFASRGGLSAKIMARRVSLMRTDGKSLISWSSLGCCNNSSNSMLVALPAVLHNALTLAASSSSSSSFDREFFEPIYLSSLAGAST
jgi:hypothetical protein